MPFPWPLISRKERVKHTLSWLHNYRAMPLPKTYGGSVPGAEYWGDVLKAAEALGEDPNPDALDALLGCDHMTRSTCNECQESVEVVLRLGAPETDYDFPTIDICISCLERAAAQMREF